MKKNKVYIVDLKRSPIGKYGGFLSHLGAKDLLIPLLTYLVKKYPFLKKSTDELILGNALPAGLGQNIARHTAVCAGMSIATPAYTINKVCGSGLKSVAIGASAIHHGDADCIVAGGVESMSNVPYYLDKHRFGVKFGDQQIRDGMLYDGLICKITHEHMGMTAERIADTYSISRLDQDTFALHSHAKAIHARENGFFDKEIIPFVPANELHEKISYDEQPRKDTTLEKLNKLKPIFKKSGTVTAGNASTLNDGASIVFLASEKTVRKHKLKPLAILQNWASVGCDPYHMGLGAYYAAESCLKKARIKKSSIDLWEINEAFSSQSIAAIQLLKIDATLVNVNGGAIALGHPIGASGARILTTLVHELIRRKKNKGIVSLCIGGGQGISALIETI